MWINSLIEDPSISCCVVRCLLQNPSKVLTSQCVLLSFCGFPDEG